MKNAGLSLLELSVVIITVALLMGGVLVGKDMIRAAEIRATVKQIEMINVAMATFKGQYHCTAGDCSRASKWNFNASPFGGALLSSTQPLPDQHWLALNFFISSAYAQMAAPVAGGPEAEAVSFVNGDGDGKMDSATEYYNGLYMLYQVGLLTGLDQSTGNVPISMSAMASNGLPGFWFMQYITPPSSDASVIKPGHYLWSISAVNEPLADPKEGAAVFLPEDAAAIDRKIDDGKPREGHVLATSHDTNPDTMTDGPIYIAGSDAGPAGALSNFCVTDDATPQYNVTNVSHAAGSLCSLTIAMDF